jgi:hypothetical protein
MVCEHVRNVDAVAHARSGEGLSGIRVLHWWLLFLNHDSQDKQTTDPAESLTSDSPPAESSVGLLRFASDMQCSLFLHPTGYPETLNFELVETIGAGIGLFS